MKSLFPSYGTHAPVGIPDGGVGSMYLTQRMTNRRPAVSRLLAGCLTAVGPCYLTASMPNPTIKRQYEIMILRQLI